MSANKNMILKQSVNFQINGKVDGLAIQQDVADWCRNVLNPSIDETLALYEQKDKIILINNINLNISVDSAGNWMYGLKEKILYQLKEKLHSKIIGTDETLVIKTLLDNFGEVILYFIKYGILPWYSGIKTQKDIETAVSQWLSNASPSTIRQLAVHIGDEKHGLRLVNLLNRHDLEKLLALFLAAEVKFITAILKDIEAIANFITAEYQLQQELIKLFAVKLILDFTIQDAMQQSFYYIDVKYPGRIPEIKTTKIINAEIKKITDQAQIKLLPVIKDTGKEKPDTYMKEISQKEAVKSISKKEPGLDVKREKKEGKKEKETTVVEASQNKPGGAIKNNVEALENNEGTKADEFNKVLQEGIFIDNAGAVIITPFLNSLFSRAGLLNGSNINDGNSALMLLHYCVTGNTTAAEFELFFPKILCGISVEKVVETDRLLSEKQLAEADEMLTAVIDYWSVIKNTSMSGLRESFLKRNGKLSLVDDTWLLQVEQKPFDMLLQQLPWSISLIKLPWMKSLLKTEWI